MVCFVQQDGQYMFASAHVINNFGKSAVPKIGQRALGLKLLSLAIKFQSSEGYISFDSDDYYDVKDFCYLFTSKSQNG